MGHVLVQRHRHDAELLCEAAHAQRIGPGPVGESDGGPQDPLPAEGVRRPPPLLALFCLVIFPAPPAP